MPITFVDDLPGLDDVDADASVVVAGESAFLRTKECLARIGLSTGQVDWLVERSDGVERFNELWVDSQGEFLADVSSSKDREITLRIRSACDGQRVWDVTIPGTSLPRPCFTADPQRLVFLHSQSSRLEDALNHPKPEPGTVVTVMPDHRPATATRFDPATGSVLWETGFSTSGDHNFDQIASNGFWTQGSHLSCLDFETGAGAATYQSPHKLGRSIIRIGTGSVISWSSDSQVGIDWLDKSGERTRSYSFALKKVHSTCLYDSGAGLGLNINDAGQLWWFGDGHRPLWQIKVRPYIYKVHRLPDTDVFVGTDGNGGRLFAFDAITGQETLNLKPVLGGLGDLAKIPGLPVLVSRFHMSKSWFKPSRLLIVSMNDRSHRIDYECYRLLSTWQNGVVGLAGKKGERLAIVDLR